MSESKLSHRQLVLIRRAAEDAIHACNRHYGPFVDVVAHPLNICALVDMALASIGQQEKINKLQKRVDALSKRLSEATGLVVDDLEQALKEGVAMNIPENFDLVKTIARRDKLRDRYYRGGLSNSDYKELLQLDKEIGQALKGNKEGENNG